MARIGGTKCQVCGQPDATVSKTATGTLSISCHRCEASAFAKVGTRAHRLVTASMTPDDDAPAAPAARPATPEAAPPVPTRRPASVFNMADLT